MIDERDQSGKECGRIALTPTGAALKRLFCPHNGVLPGATEQIRTQTKSILRVRLIGVSGLFLAVLIMFFVQGVLEERPFYLVGLPFLVIAASLVALTLRKEWGLGALRLLEAAIFGVLLFHVAVVNYVITADFAARGIAVPAMTGIYRIVFSFFAIIVAYGMFIPNTWRRAAVAVVPMVAAPLLVIYLLLRNYPAMGQALDQVSEAGDVGYLSLMLVVGVLVCVVGTHIVHGLHMGAMKARELGLYRLKEQIGEGGMGEVWKAEHRLLARPAAIKMIRPAALSSNGDGLSTAVERFKREAQATATLRSPHTVELYDFGVTREGMFFYVMEFLDGLDLETLVKRFGPVPEERAVFLLRQAAESLAEAHRKGIVHRDIKPSNLHVSSLGISDDFVKVLDFGLVKYQKSNGGDAKLTQEGVTTGTPAYMSPEMALGKTVDERSDLYSLGAVGYWLLTGRLLFDKENPLEMVVDHVKTPPTPPSQVSEIEISPCLERLILDCLEKEPEKRPQDMAEFLERLAACEVQRPWTPQRAREWWELHMPAAAA